MSDLKSLQRYEYSLLMLCEQAHMACNGSADSPEAEQLLEWRDVLESRLEAWKSGAGVTAIYDAAVRALVEATLGELRLELSLRRAVLRSNESAMDIELR